MLKCLSGRMGGEVGRQIDFLRESLGANGAHEGLLSGVCTKVTLQVILGSKRFVARFTFVAFLLGVRAIMAGQTTLGCKRFLARITDKGFLSSMRANVIRKVLLVTIRLSTIFTYK